MHPAYNYGSMSIPMPQYPANTSSTSGQYSYNPSGVGPAGSRVQVDNVMSTMRSQLDQLDRSELQELHDNEEKIHELLKENNEVKQIQEEREMHLMSNRSLAEFNMKMGEQLTESKSRLVQLYEQLNEQTRLFDENKSNLDTLSQQYNPETLLALLQTSLAQLEETSENIAEKFLEGDVTVEDFLEKYGEERHKVHIKRTKVDKLRELMRQHNRNT